MLECVINVSEGRDDGRLRALAGAAGRWLLDLHRDPDHNRSVFTVAGPDHDVETAARSLARAVVATVDLRRHHGVHPRIGALDVVPFVALSPAAAGSDRSSVSWRDGSLGVAIAARDRFARWAAEQLGLPCFCYGPERTLPDLRRQAWHGLDPDVDPGSLSPHPTAGACAVGARPLLVAYNLWLATPDLSTARRIAAEVRGPRLRCLGLAVGDGVQVSCNLIDPWALRPDAVFDAVAQRAPIARAELVGLIPAGILEAITASRWSELGLAPTAAIEARLERAGLDGGRFDARWGKR